ncbi:MAG: ABC transporter ATP-binding protein [Planctomycetota bacterium]
MTNAAISVRGLGKAYGGRPVLRALDLVVPRGELLGIVGPNGAGKSTLLRALLGLVPRDAGEVAVLGHNPASASLAIRANTCYLPGETGVYLQLTGAEYLQFAHGFYPRCDLALRDRLLAQFALPLAKKVRTYSAGMKQKLALCACLVPDVDLYVLDEPDRALDASVRFFLRDVLRAMKLAGKTIVLSSHHLGEVEVLADRLEFLLDGAFVPPARLVEARARLRQRPRIRLRHGASLPAGAKQVQQDPDGTMVVETVSDPMDWLRSVPAGDVESAEIGIPRLEDLYQLLLQRDVLPQRHGGGQ